VLKWIFERDEGKVSALDCPLGRIPLYNDFAVPSDFTQERFQQLFDIDKDAWREEVNEIRSYMNQFGDHLPQGIKNQIDALEARISS